MYEIRFATQADAQVLGEIHAASWKAAYRGIVPDEVLQNRTAEKRTDYFMRALAERREEDAIILVNGKAAGFVCIGKCRDGDAAPCTGEIWGIYLAPSFWRQGIGTRLIRWGMDTLQKRGYSAIVLWVLAENMAARAFYEKMGFLPDGAEKEIVLGKPLIECRYRKDM